MKNSVRYMIIGKV